MVVFEEVISKFRKELLLGSYCNITNRDREGDVVRTFHRL